MEKKTAVTALQDFATKHGNRTGAAIVRELLPDIEEAFRAGVSRADVLKILQEQGLSMTFRSFTGTLLRLRKERKKQGSATEPQKPDPRPSPQQANMQKQPEETKPPQKNTAQLGNFKIEKPARFRHDPTSDDDLLG